MLVELSGMIIQYYLYDAFYNSLPSERLYQTMKLDTINIWNVIDICFIFHNALFDKGLSFCQGIDNAFTVRYKYDYKTNKTESVVAKTYITFPSLAHNHYKGYACYLSTIWNGLCCIQDQLGLLLNRRTQKQATFKYHRQNLYIEADLWNYLSSHFT